MSAHLYCCDAGGTFKLAVDGKPPEWATCPVCVTECSDCPGAQLGGPAEPFPVESVVLYRCEHGHERRVSLPVPSDQKPESVQCPDCDGMLLVDRVLEPASVSA